MRHLAETNLCTVCLLEPATTLVQPLPGDLPLPVCRAHKAELRVRAEGLLDEIATRLNITVERVLASADIDADVRDALRPVFEDVALQVEPLTEGQRRALRARWAEPEPDWAQNAGAPL